jgi:hypothetical protein
MDKKTLYLLCIVILLVAVVLYIHSAGNKNSFIDYIKFMNKNAQEYAYKQTVIAVYEIENKLQFTATSNDDNFGFFIELIKYIEKNMEESTNIPFYNKKYLFEYTSEINGHIYKIPVYIDESLSYFGVPVNTSNYSQIKFYYIDNILLKKQIQNLLERTTD